MADDVVIRLSTRGGPQASREIAQVTTTLKAIGDAAKQTERTAGGSLDNLDRKIRALGQVDAGQGLKSLGNKLTLGLTAPIALAGTAVTKVALDFDRSFTRIIGLTDVTAEQAGKLRDQVLELSKATGQSPQQLAEGLYFVASAGIDVSKAMDVLKVSAEAASAGLGDTQTVAGLVTGVMGAYGKAAGTAAQTTDTLVAAVREGRAEPEAFAETLGRVLPFASQLGVSFNDIAAAVAVMSNGAIDADVATTGLRQVLADILNPAEQSKKALLDLGINSEQLRQVLREKGLLATLRLLKAEVGGNSEALGQIIPDVRALTAVLSITNQDVGRTAKVFDATANSTGSLKDAFNTFISSDPGQMSKAMADAQVAMVEFGQAILPLAADVLPKLAGVVGMVADAFSALPGPLQSLVVFGGVAAAALGPLVRLGGSIQQLRYFHQALAVATNQSTAAIATATSVQTVQASTLGQVNRNLSTYGKVTNDAASVSSLYATETKGVGASLAGLVSPLALVAGGIAVLGVSLSQRGKDIRKFVSEAAEATTEELTSAFEKLTNFDPGIAKSTFRDIAEQSEGTAKRIIAGMKAAGQDTAAFEKILADVSRGHKQAAADAAANAGATGNYDDVINGLTGDLNNNVDAMKDWADNLPLNKVLDSAAAHRSYEDELAKLDDMVRKNAEDEKARAKAVTDAQGQVTDAKKKLADAEDKYQEALAGSTQLERDRLRVSLEQAQVSAGQAALDLAAAKDRASRLSAGASPKARAEAAQAVAAAQAGVDDANTRVAESQQAIDDATPGSIGYQKRLAEAAEGVRDAQRDVRDATDKLAEAQRNAKPSAEELAQRQRDLADQIDRVVQAAAKDISFNTDQPQQATQQLYDRLKALADLFPTLQPQIDAFLKSTDVPLQKFKVPGGGVVAALGGIFSGGPLVKFAEPQTGGEAFVPRLGISQQRAAGLLGVAASWHGLRVVPMADGGIIGAGGRQFAEAQVIVVEKTTVEEYSGPVIANGLTLDEVRREQRQASRQRSLSRGSRARG